MMHHRAAALVWMFHYIRLRYGDAGPAWLAAALHEDGLIPVPTLRRGTR